MKILLRFVPLAICLFFSHLSIAQPRTFFDFEGQDFQFSVAGMVANADSLYVVTKGDNVDSLGLLLGFDREGLVDVIHSFQGTINTPNSLIGNDTILYGSTRFSENGGGALFKYEIKTGNFEILKDFGTGEAQEIEMVYVTDSVLWGLSTTSQEDEGSIFTIGLDGTGFTKIYNNTNFELGQNPVDIEIVDNRIYIACFNGGGIPYPDGTGSTVSSGSIISVNLDGSGYSNIFKGRDLVGTQPQSFIRNGDLIYVHFAERGSVVGSSLYQFNADGSNFLSLAELPNTGRGDIMLLDDLLLGITTTDLFEYDLTADTLTSLFSFNELSTFDGAAGPIFFDKNVFLATQQNGPDNGGIIAEYNYIPEVINEVRDTLVNEGFAEFTIATDSIFFDKDGDQLTLSASSSLPEIAEVSIANNIVTITENTPGTVDITISAEDEDNATVSDVFSFRINAAPKFTYDGDFMVQEEAELEENLSLFFTDDEPQELTFQATSADESIAKATVSSNVITVVGVSQGVTDIEILADDGNAMPVSGIIQVTVGEKVLSVAAQTGGTIRFYPNPVQNQLMIDLGSGQGEEVEIKILDMKGVALSSQTLSFENGVTVINIEDLESGSYLIQLNSDERSITERFLVER